MCKGSVHLGGSEVKNLNGLPEVSGAKLGTKDKHPGPKDKPVGCCDLVAAACPEVVSQTPDVVDIRFNAVGVLGRGLDVVNAGRLAEITHLKVGRMDHVLG